MSTIKCLALGLIVFTSVAQSSVTAFATGACSAMEIATRTFVFTDANSVSGPPGSNITLPSCGGAPYGTVAFPLIEIVSDVVPSTGGTFTVLLRGALDGATADLDTYLLGGMISLSLISEQTFVATGGVGIGVLTGQYATASDGSGTSVVLFTNSVSTPFGGCSGCSNEGPLPFSFQFEFGKPFTLSTFAELSFVTEPSSFPMTTADVGITGVFTGVFDLAGNPIQANFTLVPEPGTLALLLAGTGLLALRRFRQRSGEIRTTSLGS